MGDTLYRNHCVPKNSKDSLLDDDERYTVQFSRLVNTEQGKKYVRATINCGHTQFKEIVEKYGLELASKWQIWQAPTAEQISINPKAKGKNIPFQV